MEYHGFTGENAARLNTLLIIAFTRCVVATSLDLNNNTLTSFKETKPLDASDILVLNAIKNGITKYIEINGIPEQDEITSCWKTIVSLAMIDNEGLNETD